MTADANYFRIEIRRYKCKTWIPVAVYTERCLSDAYVAHRRASDDANRISVRVITNTARR